MLRKLFSIVLVVAPLLGIFLITRLPFRMDTFERGPIIGYLLTHILFCLGLFLLNSWASLVLTRPRRLALALLGLALTLLAIRFGPHGQQVFPVLGSLSLPDYLPLLAYYLTLLINGSFDFSRLLKNTSINLLRPLS